jgi:sensor c-di-GMP phosphodiesterase-like protein
VVEEIIFVTEHSTLHMVAEGAETQNNQSLKQDIVGFISTKSTACHD